MTLIIAIILALQYNLSWIWYIVIITVWLVKQLIAYNQSITVVNGFTTVLDGNNAMKKLINKINKKLDK